MQQMSKPVWVLSAMILGIGLVSAWFAQQWAGEREHALALQARIAELETQLARSAEAQERSGTGAVQDPASAVPATHDAADAPDHDWPPSGPLSEEIIAADRAYSEQERALYEDPEFREASLKETTARFRRRFAALRSELGLPPEEFERVVEALAKAELQQRIYENDEKIARTPATYESFDLASSRWQAERWRAIDLTLRDALGDARYRQWIEYQRSRPAREQLTELQATLESSGSPLTSEQQQALMPILREADERSAARLAALGIGPERPGRITDMDGKLRRQETTIEIRAEVNRSTTAAAAEILTPAQHEALVANLERELEQQRALLLIERRTLEAFSGP
jgi:hypothetical protein